MDDFDPPTQTDSSAPLVDYDSVSELTNPEPVRTVPETRNAARCVLAREAAEAIHARALPRSIVHTPPRAPVESRSLTSTPGDMKAGLTSSRPKLSIVPAAGELYQCRAMEYGADKYKRGNYHNAPPEGVAPAARVMGYVDAALRHLRAVADAYNRESPVAQGPASLTFGAALAARDTVASGGFPASGLPHLAHAMASVALAIQCGVDDSLLPDDPGQPWKNDEVTDDRSPEAAALLAGSRS